ncbi:CPBP family intramembrane glutamic endopeptidase [Roseivirga pacifica]
MSRNDNGTDIVSSELGDNTAANEQTIAVKKVKEIPAGNNLMIVIGLVLVGFFVGQLLASIVMLGMAIANGLSIESLLNDPNSLYDAVSMEAALVSQMLYTLFFTFVTPWFYLRVVAKKPIKSLSTEHKVNPLLLLIVVGATFAFMFVNAYIIEWNMGWTFPEFMSGFEQWARQMEDDLAAATERFTTFDSFGQFLLGFFAIAILPGVGEELLFRGVLQNGLKRVVKNQHVAIWVAAFIFSAIHMQIFGLVPRMVLGAIFGYLYVWSGNIWYPIIGHIANNGIGVIVAYLFSLGLIDSDMEDPESMPITLSLIGLIFFAALMFLFRNHYLKQKNIRE